jgi:hypothetical protein
LGLDWDLSIRDDDNDGNDDNDNENEAPSDEPFLWSEQEPLWLSSWDDTFFTLGDGE